MQKIVRRRDFSRPEDYSAFSVVRVYNRVLAELGGRNTWVRIKGPGGVIYRQAKGAGGGANGLLEDAMELDYDSCRDLGVGVGQADGNGYFLCEVEITRANWVQRAIAHWVHPNPLYQVPLRISMVSLALGFISLLIAVIA